MPLLGADPQDAVAPFREVEDPVAPQRRHPLAVEHLEVGAVEAGQAVEGGEPEKAVPRLKDLADPRGGQAVAGGEDLVDEAWIAGQAFERARPAGGAPEETQEDRAAGSESAVGSGYFHE